MDVRTFVVLFLFLLDFPAHASGGLSVELVLEATRRVGVSLSAGEIEIVPWARALATASASLRKDGTWEKIFQRYQ